MRGRLPYACFRCHPARLGIPALFALLLLASGASSQHRDSQETIRVGAIDWYVDHDAALEKAKREKRLLWLYFRNDPRGETSRRLDRGILNDPRVARRISRYFVPVLIDASREEKAASLLGGEVASTALFVVQDFTGRLVGERLDAADWDGSVPLEQLNRHLGSGLNASVERLQGVHALDVEFSPDGTKIASGNSDGTVTVWDAGSGDEVLTFPAEHREDRHSEWRLWVREVEFSPDGKKLASAGNEPAVVIWNVEDGRRLTSSFGHDDGTGRCSVYDLEFSPDGQRLVSVGHPGFGTGPGDVRIWDAATGEATLAWRKDHKIVAVDFSPDGERIVSGGYGDYAWRDSDRTSPLTVWDAESGEELLTLPGHAKPILRIAYSTDGRRIASGGRDGTVRIWDVSTGREIVRFRGIDGDVNSLEWSPDGTRLAAGTEWGWIRIWDTGTGEEFRTWQAHRTRVSGLGWSPDGSRIVSSVSDAYLFGKGAISVWDAETGEELMSWLPGPFVTPGGSEAGG